MIGHGTIKKTYKQANLFYYGTGGRKETCCLSMAEAVKELDIYGDWYTDDDYFDLTTIKAALTDGNQLQTPLAYYEFNRRPTDDTKQPESAEELLSLSEL